ncbi:MAG: DegT/DnrJ/EryC1/StrS family aminotransferase [Christensenellales bacterium]
MSDRIYLSPPHMNGMEMKYINEAFETNWIAPLGKNVDSLEDGLKDYLGCSSAVALSSGTSAIHLALKYLGAGHGDTVFCSDLTFSGTCNPILYQDAEPVFIDSDPKTWNMSPAALKKAFEEAAERKALPKAVIIVDIYGIPADYDELMPLCSAYGVPFIEDAAEALGASYKGCKCGTFGKIGILSFNANKIITTSGGGMLVSDDEQACKKVKFWATQSREPLLHYEHKEVGYNYRLSNISAGIGCGQLHTLDSYVEKRRQINRRYRELLADLPIGFSPEYPGAESSCWLTVITINNGAGVTPAEIIAALAQEDIESRPCWKPMHAQPVFEQYRYYRHDGRCSVSDELFKTGLCLPSGTAMTEGDLARITDVIRGCFQ